MSHLVRGLVGRAAMASLTLVAIVAIMAAGGSVAGRWRVVTILSSSMEPQFSAGDVLIALPEPPTRVRAGQVIVFLAPTGDRMPVAHRVEQVISGGARPVVITRGDANVSPDPWHARLRGPVVWRARLVVPFAGRVLLVLGRGWVRAAALGLAIVVLTHAGLRRIWRAPPPPETAGPQ